MLHHLLETTFPQHLCELYHAYLWSGQTPARWNEALVYPLCKDRKKPYTATNSRPISLLCLFRKIFESLILPVVTASGHMSYSGIQAGFRSGYSTLTNVLTLHHVIEAHPAQHIVFLDFASAFDRVGWPYLQQELQEQGMNPLVLQLVYQLMYRDMTFSLIFNGCEFQKQPRTCGLLQGSPLSPILFNRFINSLLHSLNWNSAPTFPSALFFADDGVLIAPTIPKAQSLLNHASSWADKHAISSNIPKCGYMVTNQPLRTYLPHMLTLNNHPIPHVTSYQYLGVTFASKGIDFVKQGILLCERVESCLAGMRSFSDTWALRIRLNIFKSILLPTLKYSLPLLYANYKRNRKAQEWITLTNTYNNCLTWIAGGNAKCPHITAHLLGLLPFVDRAQHLFTRYYLHLMAIAPSNPLRAILDRSNWYPKSNHSMPIHKHDPLLSQFLNPPPAFPKYLSNLQHTPISLLSHTVLEELSTQKFAQIRTTIGPHSSKPLQVSMVANRVPGLDCDVVLAAPVTDQSRFLAWRRGVFGWGPKCLCGERFDRGHTKCMPYPDPGLTEEQQFIYELDRYLIDPNTKYTIVDYLLNNRLWNQARNILNAWTLTMSNLLRSNTTHH